MKKFILSVFLGVMACSAFAEIDTRAVTMIKDIQKGVNNANQIRDLRVAGSAVVGGSATVTGAFTATGGLTTPGNLSASGTSYLGTGVSLATNVFVAPGTTTLAPTNGPAVVSGVAPSYIVVTIGGEDYYFVAYKKQ